MFCWDFLPGFWYIIGNKPHPYYRLIENNPDTYHIDFGGVSLFTRHMDITYLSLYSDFDRIFL
jgi:hypothetical protein